MPSVVHKRSLTSIEKASSVLLTPFTINALVLLQFSPWMDNMWITTSACEECFTSGFGIWKFKTSQEGERRVHTLFRIAQVPFLRLTNDQKFVVGDSTQTTTIQVFRRHICCRDVHCRMMGTNQKCLKDVINTRCLIRARGISTWRSRCD